MRSGDASSPTEDDGVRRRRLGIVLVVVGLVGLISTSWAIAARLSAYDSGLATSAGFAGWRNGSTCAPTSLPGQTVDVVLSDMGGMMEAHMMNVAPSPSAVS